MVHVETADDEPTPAFLETEGGKCATVPADLQLVTFLPDLAFEGGDQLAVAMLPVPALPLTYDGATILLALLECVDTEFLLAFAELRDLE